MLAAAVFAGHPLLGANAGVMLGCLTGAAVALMCGLPRRGWRGAALALGACAAIAAGLAVADMLRPEQERSHLGRAAAAVREGGASEAWQIVSRKASLNLLLLQRSPWALLLLAGAGGAALAGWRLKVRQSAARVLWATAAALLVFNDSGVLAAAAASLWLLPATLQPDTGPKKV